MKEVIQLLIKNNYTVSTMESCTGGGLVNEITNIENASKVLKFSAVTYSNDFKEKMGIRPETINTYSVYSMEVAKEMANCISKFTNSTYGIGITGKLKKIDENNLYNEDDVVFVSVYDSINKIYYNRKIKVTKENRIDNKKLIIKNVVNMLLEILNS